MVWVIKDLLSIVLSLRGSWLKRQRRICSGMGPNCSSIDLRPRLRAEVTLLAIGLTGVRRRLKGIRGNRRE